MSPTPAIPPRSPRANRIVTNLTDRRIRNRLHAAKVVVALRSIIGSQCRVAGGGKYPMGLALAERSRRSAPVRNADPGDTPLRTGGAAMTRKWVGVSQPGRGLTPAFRRSNGLDQAETPILRTWPVIIRAESASRRWSAARRGGRAPSRRPRSPGTPYTQRSHDLSLGARRSLGN